MLNPNILGGGISEIRITSIFELILKYIYFNHTNTIPVEKESNFIIYLLLAVFT